jgi:hypothetical protein
MRSSDTPLPQHTAVNGRSAGYGIPPNHSYDTHTQGEENSGHFGIQVNVELCVKSHNSPFYQHCRVGYRIED